MGMTDMQGIIMIWCKKGYNTGEHSMLWSPEDDYFLEGGWY